ncbi:MAG: hypothetical protein KDF60_08805 [Calditrichaeota bacterium]|nr:hypothetical protein [Calditrichota bacterium]
MQRLTILLSFFLLLLAFTMISAQEIQEVQKVKPPDPLRFANEINAFKQWDKKNSFPEQAVLFVGSSSMRMWPTADYFPEMDIINRGFGGAHITDVEYFYDDVLKKYNPAIIVFYAGDNDVAAGMDVDTVYNDFVRFYNRVENDFPAVDFFYIPIKPSLNRWSFWDKMNQTNEKIAEFCRTKENLEYIDTATPMLGPDQKPMSLFIEDGLHLNKDGYDLWSSIVKPYLKESIKDKLTNFKGLLHLAEPQNN